MLKEAIVRLPGRNFAEGLTTGALGVPHFDLVLEQHARYCAALEACGLTLTQLAADLDHPDATFVEDAAVLTAGSAILTRPGAESRLGEVSAIQAALGRFFSVMHTIDAPGTVDGGDICEGDEEFFLGVSKRTNEEGARQLAGYLALEGYRSAVADVRGMSSILHLKSGVSYIGDRTLVVMEEMAGHPLFAGYGLIRVSEKEGYAANCVRVNHRVLLPAGYPVLTAELRERGFDPLLIDMSEFQKMDGGLSCLSLRF